MTEVGKLITDSAKFMGDVGREIEALGRLAKEQLTIGIERDLKFLWIPATSWIDNDRIEESGWIYTDCAWSLGLRQRRKKNVSKHISIQISILGSGMEAEGNHEPLVHVLCWDDPVRFSDNDPIYMEFPMPEEFQKDVQLKENVLFQWGMDASLDVEWNYCLRLVSLESTEDVKRKIVKPVIALLQGKSVCDALPHNMEGLMHFSKKSESGQFRVA